MRISPRIGLLICEHINQNRSKFNKIEDAIHETLHELNLSESDYSFEAAKKHYWRHNQQYPYRPSKQKNICTDLIDNYINEFVQMNTPYFKIYGGKISETLIRQLRSWVMSEAGISVKEMLQRCNVPQRTIYSDIVYFRVWLKFRPNHQKPKQFW